jgi:dihydroneopterin aldolase
MKALSDYPNQIHLKGMSFFGYTGAFAIEKRHGQFFIVDVTLGFSSLGAIKSDLLEETVNYADVFAVIKKVVEEMRFDLIERLAGEIISSVLTAFERIDAIEVCVAKPQAPVVGTFESMSVQIFCDRAGFKKTET